MIGRWFFRLLLDFMTLLVPHEMLKFLDPVFDVFLVQFTDLLLLPIEVFRHREVQLVQHIALGHQFQ
jgi:hypothetical protein